MIFCKKYINPIVLAFVIFPGVSLGNNFSQIQISAEYEKIENNIVKTVYINDSHQNSTFFVSAESDEENNSISEDNEEESVLKSLTIPNDKEFASVNILRNQLVSETGVSNQGTLEQIYADLVYYAKNLEEKVGQELYGLGSYNDGEFALNNTEQTGNMIAEEIAKQFGYQGDNEVTNALFHILDNYYIKYEGNLPYSVIGKIVNKQIIHASNCSWYKREDQLGNSNLYIIQDYLGGNSVIDSMLNKLNNNNQEVYNKLKNRMRSVSNYLNELSQLNTVFSEASGAIEQYLKTVIRFNNNPDNVLQKKWLKVDKADARKKCIKVLISSLNALENYKKLYNYSEI